MKERSSQVCSANAFHSDLIIAIYFAATNDRVDEWKELIQNLNPMPAKTYFSEDVLCEVDDPYGFLKDMMTIEFLNR